MTTATSKRPGKLYAAVVLLPRWFGAPFVVAPIVLGAALMGAWSWRVVWAVLSGVVLMAAGHCWNSFHDWELTGLDRGGGGSAKPYSHHHVVLADGIWRPYEVRGLVFALAVASFLMLIPVMRVEARVILLWEGLAMLALWYSEAKLRWHPEVPLALAFGPMPVWWGMASSGEVAWGRGLVASIPFMLAFGIMGCWVDQYLDYACDWPKGARSFGMLVAHRDWPLWLILFPIVWLLYGIQIVLIGWGVLSALTALSFSAILPLYFSLDAFAHEEMRRGVWFGLVGLALYDLLLAVGQVLGGS